MPEIGLFSVHVDDVALTICDYALSIEGSVLQNRTDLSVLENIQLLPISSHSYSDDRFLSCCVTQIWSKVSSQITNA